MLVRYWEGVWGAKCTCGVRVSVREGCVHTGVRDPLGELERVQERQRVIQTLRVLVQPNGRLTTTTLQT